VDRLYGNDSGGANAPRRKRVGLLRRERPGGPCLSWKADLFADD